MGMRALFGPLLSKTSIFLNETNVNWFVLVNYISSVIYSFIHVKLPHLWPKTSKNDKISVGDFASTHFSKCVITFTFFNYLHEIFRINVKLNFYLILLLGLLMLVSRKIWRSNSKIVPNFVLDWCWEIQVMMLIFSVLILLCHFFAGNERSHHARS